MALQDRIDDAASDLKKAPLVEDDTDPAAVIDLGTGDDEAAAGAEASGATTASVAGLGVPIGDGPDDIASESESIDSRLLYWPGWLMFIEGLVTVIFGFISYIITPNVLEKARFLTDKERLIVVNMLRKDKSQTSLKFSKPQMWEALKDKKTWLISVVYFSWMAVNLLTSPFAIFNFVLQLGISRLADWRKDRSLWLAICGLVSTIGYLSVLFYVPNTDTERWTPYGLLFFACFNSGSLPLILGLTTSNIVGHTKRTVSVTIIVLASAFGGVAGGQIYRDSDAPRYLKGHTANMILITTGLVCLLTLRFLLHSENTRRDKLYGPTAHGKQAVSELDGAFDEEFTDKDKDFRYSL
ncbi:hypothetical protein HDU96_009851 [Phlyctochytrium bullatum]|nr:hypothetical protein HDU96_009851 [Phlyctochytrium bullatum]